MIEMTSVFPLQQDEVLLAMKKRGHGAGRWNGMGGKVEAGETLEEAACREVNEEIGIIVSDLDKRAELIFDELHNGVRKLLKVHVYTCNTWEGEPQETDEMAPRRFLRDEIPYDEMWADDPFWLPQVLNGKLIIARFKLDEGDRIVSKDVREVTSL